MSRMTNLDQDERIGVTMTSLDLPKKKHRYIPGLDGLRAIAVLAVIAYHLNFGWAQGGLLGVGIFFVLSGYLITDLLAVQWERSKRLDFKDFWTRRARRLLPAVFFMLVVVMAWITLFARAELPSLRADVLAAILYVSNWWFIFHHVSYFASFGPPSPLGHLWSLAVEEQFYLFWPILLYLGLRYGRRWGRLAVITLFLAAVSALLMVLLYQPGMDPSRVYYGTDTRAFGLLIGAALALIWPSQHLSSSIPRSARHALDLTGILGLSGIVVMIWLTNEYDAFLYRGGLVLLSIATAMVVASLVHPAGRLGKLLGWKPLRWLGVRSYGIYLWHYPVILLSSSAVDTGTTDIPRAVLQVGVSIALAALSWKFVEEPIRYGKSRSALGNGRNSKWRRGRLLALGSAVVALGVSLVGIGEPIPAATTSFAPNVTSITPELASTSKTNLKPNQGSDSTASVGTRVPTATTKPSNAPNAGGTSPKPKPVTGQGITAIGDSVMIDIAPNLQKILPSIIIDAKVGRQMYQLPAVVADLKAKGLLGNRVIIETGTNGPFTKAQMISFLKSLGPVKQIILVNTRVPRPWESTVNSTLAAVAAAVPHTSLVNWYNASKGHNGYFYPDGVHLNPQGASVYATLVVKAISVSDRKS